MSITFAPALVALAVLIPTLASAQSDWTYNATLYGWFPGISTKVKTPVAEVEGEVGFDEVLDSLDFAFLGAIEARKGRVALIGDLQYYDFGIKAHPPNGLLYREGKIDQKLVLFSGYATYAVADAADFRFELGGGLRFVQATIDTQLAGVAPTPDLSQKAEGNWADLIVGTRVNKHFNERWHAFAYADVGGFGIGNSSDLTWQVSFGQSYKFSDGWSVAGGYRHLSIKRKFKNADVTTETSGPFLGFKKTF